MLEQQKPENRRKLCVISNFNWTEWLQISIEFIWNNCSRGMFFSEFSKEELLCNAELSVAVCSFPRQSLMHHLLLQVFGIIIMIAAKVWKCRTSQIKYFSWNSSFCCSNLEHCRRVPLHLTYLFVHVWSCFQWFPVEKKITACWSHITSP